MRTKGATSNVAVRLSDLNQVLQPNAIVLVARRQADQLGLIGRANKATEENIVAAGNQPAIEEKCAITEIIEETTESQEKISNDN